VVKTTTPGGEEKMKHYKHEKLQHCPFCGADAEIAVMENRTTGTVKFFANCTNEDCVINRHYPSEEEAIKAWNEQEQYNYCPDCGSYMLVSTDGTKYCDKCKSFK
jgi:formate dehydrogenase maturation protein FdhE